MTKPPLRNGLAPRLVELLGRFRASPSPVETDADRRAVERQAAADVTEYLLRTAGVPPIFAAVDLTRVPADFPPKYLRAARRLLEMERRPQTLVLGGDVGLGKTALACGLCRFFKQAGRSARYTTACRYLQAVGEADFNRKAKVRQAYERAALVAVDEIGDPHTHQPGRDGELLELIDRRFSHGQSTLLLTNLSAEAFVGTYGAKLKRRVVESGGGFHVADWPRIAPIVAGREVGRG